MTGTQRLNRALERLESRRIEIEGLILADIERLLSADDSGIEDTVVHHLGSEIRPAVVCEDDGTTTHSGSGFTFTWFGIG